jgi:hypothetical protein
MKTHASIKNDRREFLRKTFSSCALCFFAAPIAFGSDRIKLFASNQKHKFQSDSGMTMQEVYTFAFTEWYIPAMKNLMALVGREKFLEMLKKSSDMLSETDKNATVNYNERTLTAFTDNFKKYENFFKLRNTFEFIQSDDHVLELNCTECLWAKTFREADAADIGYAGCCYGDYAYVKAYNPKMKLIREKTLMQGNDVCHFKWIMES